MEHFNPCNNIGNFYTVSRNCSYPGSPAVPRVEPEHVYEYCFERGTAQPLQNSPFSFPSSCPNLYTNPPNESLPFQNEFFQAHFFVPSNAAESEQFSPSINSDISGRELFRLPLIHDTESRRPSLPCGGANSRERRFRKRSQSKAEKVRAYQQFIGPYFSPVSDQPPPVPARNSTNGTMALTGLISGAEKDMQLLTQKTKECDGFWQQLKEQQSHFVIKLTEIQQLRALLQQNTQTQNGQLVNQQRIDQLKAIVEQANRQAGLLYQTLVDTRKAILLSLKDSADFVSKLRKDLVNKVLLEWKKGQKLAQIGFPFDRQDEFLDKIALHFEQLADETWSLRTYALWVKDLLQQAPNLPDNNVQQCISVLQPIGASITRELESLVRESFIVSKQPNVVLKQHNKFTAETRLLVGDKLGFKLLNVKVGVKLISEEHARALKDGSLPVQQAATVAKIGFGPVANSSGDAQDVIMEVERESRRVRACFKSRLLKVDPRKSGGKNNDEQQQVLVCERNYALLFSCSSFQLGEMSFPCVWTLSLPVKLTVHGSQERLSQAMILWDHAFAPPEAPFNVPEAVEWSLLSEALRSKFMVQTGVTRGLCKSDLDYLAEKLMNTSPSATPKQALVTLQRFCKEPMREDTEFAFWAWFFEIMALIKQKLQRYWDDGFVKGFISRTAASELHLSQQQPSFLLRFSDTHLGGLSISFAAVDEATGRKEVFPLAPLTAKDLDHLSLAQRIAGCPQLQQAEIVCGADGLLLEKSMIFRKEAEMNVRQRPAAPTDRDGHPYILSDLVMVARINNRGGTESNPLSPAPQGSWSPGQELTQAMLEGVDTSSEAWEGTPLDINSIDWHSWGIVMPSNQQTSVPMPMIVDEAETDNASAKRESGGDAAVIRAAESMQDLLNLMNDDGPVDPHFRRQIAEQHASMLSNEMHAQNSDANLRFKFE